MLANFSKLDSRNSQPVGLHQGFQQRHGLRKRVGPLTAKAWFPAPAIRLAMGAVWKMADIEQMASETGRTLDYPALESHLTAMADRHRADPNFRGLL